MDSWVLDALVMGEGWANGEGGEGGNEREFSFQDPRQSEIEGRRLYYPASTIGILLLRGHAEHKTWMLFSS